MIIIEQLRRETAFVGGIFKISLTFFYYLPIPKPWYYSLTKKIYINRYTWRSLKEIHRRFTRGGGGVLQQLNNPISMLPILFIIIVFIFILYDRSLKRSLSEFQIYSFYDSTNWCLKKRLIKERLTINKNARNNNSTD